jgi:hypothetical protein
MANTTNASMGEQTMSYGTVQAEKLTTESGYSLGAGNASSFKNRIINGDMRIDQRNLSASISTSTTGSQTYASLDRWGYIVSQASKFTMQQDAGAVTPPAGFTDYLGCTSTAATSVGSGDYFQINQIIEGYNIADLNWGTANAKPITISFWVRSSLTGTFGGSLRNGSINRSYPFTYTISAANTWELETITIPGDTSGTWSTTNGWGLQVIFGLGMGSTFSGTAGAWASANFASATGATSVVSTNGATFYITGVQLEVGTVATSWDFRSYGAELALCQRYYWKNSGGIWTGINIASGAVFSFPVFLPVSMRTAPTFSTNMTDANTSVSAAPNSNQWSLYSQNSGWPTYSGSINTLSASSGPGGQVDQISVGTYSFTPASGTTAFYLGSNIYFQFSSEL